MSLKDLRGRLAAEKEKTAELGLDNDGVELEGKAATSRPSRQAVFTGTPGDE